MDETAALIACVNARKVLHLKGSFSVVRQVEATGSDRSGDTSTYRC